MSGPAAKSARFSRAAWTRRSEKRLLEFYDLGLDAGEMGKRLRRSAKAVEMKLYMLRRQGVITTPRRRAVEADGDMASRAISMRRAMQRMGEALRGARFSDIRLRQSTRLPVQAGVLLFPHERRALP